MMDLEPLLVRQLKKAGHTDPGSAPTDETWTRILKRISDHYHHIQEDREMLVRSLDLLTAEMAEGTRSHGSDQDSVAQLMADFARALSALSSASRLHTTEAADVEEVTREIQGAEDTFLDRLNRLDLSVTGSTPEAAVLRQTFTELSDQLKKSLGQRASHLALMKEFERASSVQQLLMPGQSELQRPFMQLAGWSMPAMGCSGDWWTVHDLPDGRVQVVVGDVTGHGLSAGIITGAAKASCEVGRFIFGDKLTSSGLLQVMNCGIEGAGRREMLMTCVVATIDPHERCLVLANAGHVLPYLVRREGDRCKVLQLRAHGPPLGVTRNAKYSSVRVELQEGDLVFFYTDGLLEREGPTQEQFGRRRLMSVLEQSSAFEPAGVRDALLHHLTRHAGEAPVQDDVTFIAIRFGELK